MNTTQLQSPTAMSTPATNERRHDIDTLRTIALTLLIFYHCAVSFQPWGGFFGFPVNHPSFEALGPVMAMVNVWRIPLLFLVSGMGVCFAMERRSWLGLIKERSVRVLLPWLSGICLLNPLFAWLMPKLGWQEVYKIQFGHLWFLLNIYLYALWFVGFLIYFKNEPDNPVLRFLRRVVRWPLGLYLLAIPYVIEAAVVRPQYFSLYVDTVHGWLLGAICFAMGFVFVSLKEDFWKAAVRTRWVALAVGAALYLVRLLVYHMENYSNALIALESVSWMYALLGFASLYLNRPSRVLSYCSKAVFPVYIVHMPVQFVLAHLLFPTGLGAPMKFTLLTLGTLAVSVAISQLILRHTWYMKPVWGIKLKG